MGIGTVLNLDEIRKLDSEKSVCLYVMQRIYGDYMIGVCGSDVPFVTFLGELEVQSFKSLDDVAKTLAAVGLYDFKVNLYDGSE